MIKKPIGIYIHVPFCVSKCSYCDFYSLQQDSALKKQYVQRIISEIHRWGRALGSPPADTLYFGGGTPSLLSANQIVAIIDSVKQQFSLKSSEITLEVNPAENLDEFFSVVAKGGVNRVSIGLQSANSDELKVLSRRHTANDVKRTVAAARAAGIRNISVDIMLGIPNQTKTSLKQSIDFVENLNVEHVSAYLLSLEAGTPLYNMQNKLNIPTADEAGELYLKACELLRNIGYNRYEISNFAKGNMISRHNTKYWMGEEYLGLGPAAHSFINGKRFYYERDIKGYLAEPKEIYDGSGGDLEEAIMLRLRLKKGIKLSELKSEFKDALTDTDIELINKTAEVFLKNGLVDFDGDAISLTDKGALVSNSVIASLLDCIN